MPPTNIHLVPSSMSHRGFVKLPRPLLDLRKHLHPTEWAIVLDVYSRTAERRSPFVAVTRNQMAKSLNFSEKTIDRRIKALVQKRKALFMRESGKLYQDLY